MQGKILGYTPVALASVLSAVLLWAISFPALRLGLRFFPPVTMALLRYGLAALPVLAYFHFRFGMRRSLSEAREDLPLLLALGVFSVAIPNITQNLGLWRNESSSLTAIIQASSPAFAVLLAFMVLKESIGWKKVMGIVLAVSATSLLAAGDLTLQGSTFEGNLLILASSVSYGVSGIIAKTLLSRREPGVVVGWSFIFGALLILPAVPLDWGLPLTLEAEGWFILLFLAFLPGVLASFLFYVVLQGQDLSRLVFFLYLIPVLAAIPSVLFLGEIVTLRMAFLGILIIVGVAIAQHGGPATGLPRG